MRVDRLAFSGFRNLAAGEWIPGAGVNILYGDNAQGKTNLLEALWLFTGGRSFRGAKDSELKQFGAEKSCCWLEFTAQERQQEAEIRIEKRRSASLNGIAQPSAGRLAGVFCAIVFSPEHLTLIKGGPEGRRKFLDAAYCQVRPGYIAVLGEYMRTLQQRNALFRDARQYRPDEDMLDLWDHQLAQAGARVHLARTTYIRRLREAARDIYAGLSSGAEELTLAYKAENRTEDMTAAQAAEALLEEIRGRRQADLAAGFTTAGPHRDDLEVCINGMAARVYGSQGQQRSAVLALKMAEASILRQVSGEQPVALLDDVMSELDVSRQDYIFNHIHDWQVFITCCDPSAVQRVTGGRVFHVKHGVLTPKSVAPEGG